METFYGWSNGARINRLTQPTRTLITLGIESDVIKPVIAMWDNEGNRIDILIPENIPTLLMTSKDKVEVALTVDNTGHGQVLRGLKHVRMCLILSNRFGRCNYLVLPLVYLLL